MSNAELFRAIQRWSSENYQGDVTDMRLTVTVKGGYKTSFHIPSPKPPEVKEEEGFVPNAVQSKILELLEGKAMKSTEIAKKIHSDTARVCRKKGGMGELQEQGLVRWSTTIGYFRPDAPPEGFTEEE